MTNKEGWLFVLPCSPQVIGGVSTVVLGLCRAMNNDGHYKPFILVEDWAAAKPMVTEYQDYTEIRFRLRSISATIGYERLSYFLHLPLTLLGLLRLFKKYNIKVINPHYPSLTSMSFALLKLLKARMSFLLSFHGSDLSDIEKQPNSFAMWRFLLQRAEQLVSCSKGMAERVANTFPEIASRSQYIHNGIGDNFFEQPKNDYSQKELVLPKNYILSVGTFQHQKGQDSLIEAFSLISTKFSDLDLVLVGRTASELEKYKLLVKSLGLSQKVHFYENIALSNIKPFYEGARVYVSASRNEAFGIVMLEAAAFKVPVIATKTIGACEIIENGVDGKLVDIDDTDAIAEQMTLLLSDKAQSERLAEKLYYKAKHEFTWVKALGKYQSYTR